MKKAKEANLIIGPLPPRKRKKLVSRTVKTLWSMDEHCNRKLWVIKKGKQYWSYLFMRKDRTGKPYEFVDNLKDVGFFFAIKEQAEVFLHDLEHPHYPECPEHDVRIVEIDACLIEHIIKEEEKAGK